MMYQQSDSQQEEVFDPEVLCLVQSEKIPTYLKFFADLNDFKRSKCFIKTEFHTQMFKTMVRFRNKGQRLNIVGIQGLGKTASVLYYILSCIKKGDTCVHYIDLKRVEKKDPKLKKIELYADTFDEDDFLVIDHVTLSNTHFTHKIESMVFSKDINIVLIETGFTASAGKLKLDFGKNQQCSEEDFLKIWNGTTCVTEFESLEEMLQFKEKGTEVYSMFKEHFVMTPRLLHHVFNAMFVLQRTAVEALMEYKIHLRNEIEAFKDSEENNSLYNKFILHTKVLLRHLDDNCIYTEEEFENFLVAINIFHVESCTVTKSDLENEVMFMEKDLKEGNKYVRLSHLTPILSNYWRKKLPFVIEDVLEDNNAEDIISIIFKSGSPRIEFENMLVKYQKSVGQLIIPKSGGKTSCYIDATLSKFIAKQCERWSLGIEKNLCFYQPKLDDFRKVDIDSKYGGAEKNVARCAIILKEKISKYPDQAFLLYPGVDNLMGADYFLYCPGGYNTDADCFTPKKRKEEDTLFVVQVAIGASHAGETIGRALNIIKGNIQKVVVHAVVMIAQKDTMFYPLTGKYKFTNISVINLYPPEWAQDKFLQRLIKELVK